MSLLLKALEEAHVQKAREDFGKHLHRFLDLWKQHPEEIREILANWDEFVSLTLAPGRIPLVPRGMQYQAPLSEEDVPELLCWVTWFVGHEIWDDGDPRVLWAYPSANAEGGMAPLDGPEGATFCGIFQGHDAMEGLASMGKPLDLHTLKQALEFERGRKIRAREIRGKMLRAWWESYDEAPSKTSLFMAQILKEISS